MQCGSHLAVGCSLLPAWRYRDWWLKWLLKQRAATERERERKWVCVWEKRETGQLRAQWRKIITNIIYFSFACRRCTAHINLCCCQKWAAATRGKQSQQQQLSTMTMPRSYINSYTQQLDSYWRGTPKLWPAPADRRQTTTFDVCLQLTDVLSPPTPGTY